MLRPDDIECLIVKWQLGCVTLTKVDEVRKADIKKFSIETRTRPTGETLYFVINHTRQPQSVALPFPAREHLTGQTLRGALELAPYAVAVLTETTR